MNVKRIFFIIITTALFMGKISSQIITPSVTRVLLSENDRAIFNEHLSEYTVFTINKIELINYLYTNKTGKFQIYINENLNWTIDLLLNDMRAPNYRQTYISEEGVFKQEEFVLNTFKGKTSDNKPARFTIDENNFFGVILDSVFYYVIRPAKDYTRNNSDERFIVYKSSDIIYSNETIDYINDALITPESNNVEKVEEIISRGGGNSCSYYLEIATDADYEYFVNAGGSNVSNTNQNIINVLNIVEGLYESTFDIKFRVTYQNVYATSSTPYTSTVAETLLTQFRNNWNNNYTNYVRDIAHLFTGKNLDGSVVGISYKGQVGNNNSYSISMNRYGMFTTTAHELGHNFNASDANLMNPVPLQCNCGTGTASVMCQGIKDPNLWFCDVSINEMLPFIISKRNLLNNMSVNNIPTNLTLSGTQTGNKEYTAKNNIQSTQVINSGKTTYTAGNKVVLSPGFKVELGSEFKIAMTDIEYCDPISVSGTSINVICKDLGIDYTVSNAKYYSFKVYYTNGALVFSRDGIVQGNNVHVWNASGVPTGYYVVDIKFYSPNDEFSDSYNILVQTCN